MLVPTGDEGTSESQVLFHRLLQGNLPVNVYVLFYPLMKGIHHSSGVGHVLAIFMHL